MIKRFAFLLAITCFVTGISGFAQSKPDQIRFQKYILAGKTKSELRLMRNEIFARYGYRFRSNDLKEWFEQKRWYHPSRNNVDSLLTDIDKENIRLIQSYETNAIADSSGFLLVSEDMSWFRSFINPNNGRKYFNKHEVSFYEHCQFGVLKKIIDQTYEIGQEMPYTVVYAEAVGNNLPYWHTASNFNDLDFRCDHYKAIEYGCCGSETRYELFNYESDTPFLIADRDIYELIIPGNPGLTYFVGYDHESTNRDSLEMGYLQLSSLKGVISKIVFRAESKEDFNVMTPDFSPEIAFKNSTEGDEIIHDGKTVKLWHLQGDDNLSRLRHVSVVVKFTREDYFSESVNRIEIDHGTFFGMKEKTRVIPIHFE